MKKPKQILEEYNLDDDCLFGRNEEEISLSQLIEEIQRETYNQAILDVLNNVELNLKSTDENAVYYKKAISCEFNGHSSTITVDKDSIIKLKIDRHV